MTFKKPCKRCGKMFEGLRTTKLCKDCYKKIWILRRLKIIRESLSIVIKENINSSDEKWYRNIAEICGLIDNSIMRIEKIIMKKNLKKQIDKNQPLN